jgi:hypothetical protein
MSNNIFDSFLENYEINVLNDTKRRAVRGNLYFEDINDASIVRTEFRTERVYTIEIPEGRLRSLAELESRFFNYHKHNKSEIDLFEALMEKERSESYYRNTVNAVNVAYKEYSMLLHLAGYQEKI